MMAMDFVGKNFLCKKRARNFLTETMFYSMSFRILLELKGTTRVSFNVSIK